MLYNNKNFFFIIFYCIILIFQSGFSDWGKIYDEMCSDEQKRKHMDCNHREYAVMPRFSKKEALKNISKNISECNAINHLISTKYELDIKDRDKMMVIELEREMESLKGPSPEIVLGFKIKKKTPRGWFLFHQKAGEKFIDNVGIILKLNKHVARLKGIRKTEFPEFLSEIKTLAFPPQIGIKITNGWILGADGGEWGGYLIHVDRDKNVEELLWDNVKAIHETSSGLIVITGLIDFEGGHGYVYKFNNIDGKWFKKKIGDIYGGSYFSDLINNEEIIFGNSYNTFLLKGNSLCKIRK